jgi:hypothetical protein
LEIAEEFINNRMNPFQKINSDSTMVASKAFENILDQIGSSNLCSNLCHLTPKINFLSNTLPNLDTILWVEPDNTYQDEAE